MKFVAIRFVQLIVVMLVATFFTYALIFVNDSPDEVVTTLLQLEAGSEEARERIEDAINADDPFLVRYGKWLGDALTFDLGRSYSRSTSVSDLLIDWDPFPNSLPRGALPTTLALGVYAQVFALILAVPAGVLAAWRANTWLDRGLSTASIGLLAIPNYVMAVLLVYLFALQFSFFPVIAPSGLEITDVRSFFLPALSLGLGQVAIYMRLLRTDMIATLQEDFIGMARAKGMPTRRILIRHALRPSSLSLVTVLGINAGALIGGTVIIESIFAMPGMGNVLVGAIFQRDILVIQAIVAIIAFAFVVINFGVDLLYAALDPRIRRG